ncbi:hypothetical protein [Streptomyces sp. NPDC048516]|uniref:hypothetical protein n=1 Tax=Streptomyces sp. NPDC048516 TaxID=3365565 RepID=UPI0037227F48
MKPEGTTPPGEGNGNRRARYYQRLRRALQWRRRPTRQNLPTWQRRPLWQEPLRGALYTAGGSAITLLTPWIQHWLQSRM